MRIHFLGGADEVGASSLLIEMAGQRILIDAGVRVSPKMRDGLSGEMLPDLSILSDQSLDAVLVTHAHADHIGALPLVFSAKPDVPAYTTPATMALTQVMFRDSLRIMDMKSEQEGDLPHYDALQVELTEKAWRAVEFHQPFLINGVVRVQFFCAGHVPGAASILLESPEGTLLVSGDLSFSPLRATPKAEIPPIHPDVLILESTYGGKLHANRRAEEARLIEAVAQVVNNGGRVLVPAFALGRAQEIALILDAGVIAGTLPPVPIYLDGMTRAIGSVFVQQPRFLSEELQRYVEKNNRLFRSDAVKTVKTMAERNEIAMLAQPSVIIASSGMLTGGASAFYAQKVLHEPKSAVFITGYQDDESPGRALQRLGTGESKTITVNGKRHEVHCQVATYSLSAHADENELTHYASRLTPQITYLVHGDGGARERMAELLKERNLRVELPRLGQTVEPIFETLRIIPMLQSKGVGRDLAFSPALLWEKLTEAGMGGTQVTLEQLADFWHGENAPVDQFKDAIQPATLYFQVDWRNPDHYRIRSKQEVEREQPRYDWLDQLGDLRGKLLLLQTEAGLPNFALLREANGIHLEMTTGKLATTVVPAERIVMVAGLWDGNLPTPEDETALAALQQEFEKLSLELDIRTQAWLSTEKFTDLMDGQPRTLALFAEQLGVADQLEAQLFELAWRLLSLKAKTAYGIFHLYPPALQGKLAKKEDVDFNTARQFIEQLFPPKARLRKVSGDLPQKLITLRFDFPVVATTHYAELVAQAIQLTGWRIEIHDSINQLALFEVAQQLVPTIKGQPALHLGQKRVEVKLDNVPEDFNQRQELYFAQTGFTLAIAGKSDTSNVAQPTTIRTTNAPIEINAAYARLREVFEPQGLYKTSLKEGKIVLSFITPEVGERYREQMAQLAEEIGYPLAIHPHPNQNDLIQLVQRIAHTQGVSLQKVPSLQVMAKTIEIQPSAPIPETVFDQMQQMLQEQTGYRLSLKR